MGESVFLGTGAAELYPNPFCGCKVCARARAVQKAPGILGNELRLRSAFLLDPETLIDFGPDVPAGSQHYHAPLDRVRQVLVTHSHEDHFSGATFSILTMTDMKAPIHFYISSAGLAWADRLVTETAHISGTFGNILAMLKEQGKIALYPVDPYKTYEIGGKKVTPLATCHQAYGHGETAQNYLIDWQRGTWLYACDTGLYGPENLGFLARYAKERGAALDLVIMEGTFGSLEQGEDSGHMDARRLCRQLAALENCGAVSRSTQVYITHINQVQAFSHEEYQDYLDRHAPVRAVVAWDGMRV